MHCEMKERQINVLSQIYSKKVKDIRKKEIKKKKRKKEIRSISLERREITM